MVKFCVPIIPEIYEIKCLIYVCNSCGNIFAIALPNYDGLVMFKEIDGEEIRWLSTYEKGGYLDLMDKLIPEYSSIINNSDENSMERARTFIIELNKHCEKGKHKKGFVFNTPDSICPHCTSKEATELKEIILTNPKLNWMKINCKLLE